MANHIKGDEEMSVKKKEITVSAKTKKFIKKLVRGTKQDPVSLEIARRSEAPRGKPRGIFSAA
jgi:hypothetical protein